MTASRIVAIAACLLGGACASLPLDPPPQVGAAAFDVISDESWTALGGTADGGRLTYRIDPASQARLVPGVVIIWRRADGVHALRQVTATHTPDPADPAVVELEVAAISAYKVFTRVAIDVDEEVALAVARDALVLGDTGLTLRDVALTYQPRITATISTENASAYAIEGPVTRFAQTVAGTLPADRADAEPQVVPVDVPVISVPFRRDLAVMFDDRVEMVPFFGTVEVEVGGQYQIAAAPGLVTAGVDCRAAALTQRVSWATAWTIDKEVDGACTIAAAPTGPAAARIEAGLRLRYQVKIYDFVAPTFEQFLGVVAEPGDATPRVRGWARTRFHMEHLPVGAASANPSVQTKPVTIVDAPLAPLVRHGIVSRPVSDEAPEGWGAPHLDPTGAAINPPLGTVGGTGPFALLVPGAAGAWRVFRDLEGGVAHASSYGNLDWVYQRDSAVAGYVTWKGPHGRAVPEAPIPVNGGARRGVRLGDYVNVISGGDHYYVYRGTKVFLDGEVLYDFGAVGYVAGAAIRHVGGKRYLLAATTNFGEDVDRLWSVELDLPMPIAVAVGVVALPVGYEWDRAARANSYFCNQSATRCATVIQAMHETPFTSTSSRTENGVTSTAGGGGATLTTAPLVCTVVWSGPMAATSTCTPPTETPWHTVTNSAHSRVEVAGQGSPMLVSDHDRTDGHTVAAVVAVDFMGDQEVQLTRTASLVRTTTHHDTSMVPDSVVHEVERETRHEALTAPGWSITADTSFMRDTSMTLNYPVEQCMFSRTSSSSAVEVELLHVDLRYGARLYLVTRFDDAANDAAASTPSGWVPCVGASARSSTFAATLFYNGTVVAAGGGTTSASVPITASESYFWDNNHSGAYFDTGVISASTHTSAEGVQEVLVPQYDGFPLADAAGASVGTFFGTAEVATTGAGATLLSVGLPTFGAGGAAEPIVHRNRLSGLADPSTSVFELQGTDPRFDYLGLR